VTLAPLSSPKGHPSHASRPSARDRVGFRRTTTYGMESSRGAAALLSNINQSRRRTGGALPKAKARAIGMTHNQEVQVQTRDPDGGNPTLKRQGRWPCSGLKPARGRLVEVIGARPFRAKAKRREASAAGELAGSSEAQFPLVATDVRATGWPRRLCVLPDEVCRAPSRGR
jgi:hypothetical protein